MNNVRTCNGYPIRMKPARLPLHLVPTAAATLDPFPTPILQKVLTTDWQNPSSNGVT